MQIVSVGDNLHEMLKPVFWEKNKKKIFQCHRLKILPKVYALNVNSKVPLQVHPDKGSIQIFLLFFVCNTTPPPKNTPTPHAPPHPQQTAFVGSGYAVFHVVHLCICLSSRYIASLESSFGCMSNLCKP